VLAFLFHSGKNGPEGSKKGEKKVLTTIGKEHLPLTKQVVLTLASQLMDTWGKSNRRFLLFIDNLFLNGAVAKALLQLGVLCCGTTQKNCKDFLNTLLAIKNHNRMLVWDSYTAVINQGVLFAV
jgi:hypothetical protein